MESRWYKLHKIKSWLFEERKIDKLLINITKKTCIKISVWTPICPLLYLLDSCDIYQLKTSMCTHTHTQNPNIPHTNLLCWLLFLAIKW